MAKKNYYAVASGKRTGIFDSWDEARPLVERVRGALHKGFATRDEAEKWLAEQYGQPLTENHDAVRVFERDFGYRAWSSVRDHVNRFNGGQTTPGRERGKPTGILLPAACNGSPHQGTGVLSRCPCRSSPSS